MSAIGCGSSIRNGAMGSGTAGCLINFSDSPARVLMLTAGHALVPRTAKQDDLIEAVNGETRPIGRLRTWSGLDGRTTVDAALVWVDPRLVTAALPGAAQTPTGLNLHPRVGDPIRLMTRRTNEAVETKIAELNFTATMSVPSWNAPRLAYAGQIRCWPSVSLPGDSGAIFVDRDNRVVGMLVGGTAGVGDVVTPIGEIMTYPGWNGQPSLVTRIPDDAVPPRNEPARSEAPGNSTNTALPPVSGTTFTALKARYEALFERCQPLPSRAGDIAYYLDHLRAGKARYEAVGQATRVPWWFIGIVHGLEGSFRFDRHLHNGDPLTGRTVRVPAGRPSSGTPPFAWSDSAVDALQYEGLADQSDWSLARTLYRFERYNGYGYYQYGINSPYLWSFSNLYTKGKYIADHKFDANVVSDQCGAAVLLKQLVALGEASF